MKKIILFLNVCLVLTLFANCSNGKKNEKKADENKDMVEIPDANFKAYLLDNFDTNKDGKISFAEAEAVTEIDCSAKQIKDLKGIESFVNLESLNCSFNELEDIEIQKNNKLNKLDCRRNKASFVIYFSSSSSLRNPTFENPPVGGPPENTGSLRNPIDESKCLYDLGTIIKIDFD
jgi:hypothetical protein